jgi:hypothetical protein
MTNTGTTPTVGEITPRQDFIDATGYDRVSVVQGPVLSCTDCGCIFVPMNDGAFYPDRFVIAAHEDFPEHGCNMRCDCHKIPAEIA